MKSFHTDTHQKTVKINTLSDFKNLSHYQYNGTPTPRFKANDFAINNGFLSQEAVLAKVPIHDDKDETLTSVILETYSDYIKKNNVHDRSAEISPEQMLWIVTVAYPHGIDTKGGFYDNAKANYAFDAATGRSLFFVVTGRLKSTYQPH
jgi:hypothetical protein